jgi:hypothetical protein
VLAAIAPTFQEVSHWSIRLQMSKCCIFPLSDGPTYSLRRFLITSASSLLPGITCLLW